MKVSTSQARTEAGTGASVSTAVARDNSTFSAPATSRLPTRLARSTSAIAP